MKNFCKMMPLGIIFFVIGNCCNVVEVNQEFARQILVAFAVEQTLFFTYNLLRYVNKSYILYCRKM